MFPTRHPFTVATSRDGERPTGLLLLKFYHCLKFAFLGFKVEFAFFTTMVFERLQALSGYFEQLKASPEYGRLVEKQCVEIAALVRDLSELKLDNATPLLALIQQSSHWTDDHKKTLVQAIHSKVEETMNGKVLKERFPMQDYTLFPLYLTRNDWHVVLNQDYNVAQKCTAVMNRLFLLGVRCPSEPTYAMVTAVILLREPERFNDPLQLRSSYLTVKGICKTTFGQQDQRDRRPAILHSEGFAAYSNCIARSFAQCCLWKIRRGAHGPTP